MSLTVWSSQRCFSTECRKSKAKVITQGLVVLKPINANPRLKVNRSFHLAGLKSVLKANVKLMVKTNVSQKRDKNLLEKSLLIGN